MLCSYELARAHASAIDPHYILSLMDPGAEYDLPVGSSLTQHVRIAVHDVVSSDVTQVADWAAPTEEHVREILDLTGRWRGRGRLLVHCHAGISRSAAAAMILFAARNPGNERTFATLLRDRAPWVDPNRRMIGLADAMLARSGALLKALDCMGPPRMRGPTGPVLLPATIA